MASNKKTTKPCFSNGTEAMMWEDSQCQHCVKYTTYNEKLGRYPQFKCAVQRDIVLQQVGTEEISLRSWEACQQEKCPYFESKDKPKPIINVRKAQKFAPTPLFDQKAINISAEAEKMRTEKIKKAKEEEQAKWTALALQKAEARRVARYTFTAKEHTRARCKSFSKDDLTPEQIKRLEEKSIRIKDDVNALIAHYIGRYNTLVRAMLDIGESYMRDCIAEFIKKGLYRFKNKLVINNAVNDYDRIYSFFASRTKVSAEFNSVVLDGINDIVDGDIKKQLYSVKNILDKHNTKDSAMKARAEVVYFLYRSAFFLAQVIKQSLKQDLTELVNREGLSITSKVRQLMEQPFINEQIENLMNAWERVCRTFCTYSKEVIDEIGNDPIIVNGMKIIERKLTDTKKIEEICNQVLKDNEGILEGFYVNHPEYRGTEMII